jgi:hypothetical protein
MIRLTASLAAAGAAVLLAWPAASAEMIQCKLRYDLEGWSILYKQAKGSGRITCSNGQAADVRIATYGGGLTLGTHKVIGGTGSFSAVGDISELYGSYAEADVHAGAGGSANARAMMKSNVNLTLAGTGQGIGLGLAFGAFNIHPK